MEWILGHDLSDYDKAYIILPENTQCMKTVQVKWSWLCSSIKCMYLQMYFEFGTYVVTDEFFVDAMTTMCYGITVEYTDFNLNTNRLISYCTVPRF